MQKLWLCFYTLCKTFFVSDFVWLLKEILVKSWFSTNFVIEFNQSSNIDYDYDIVDCWFETTIINTVYLKKDCTNWLPVSQSTSILIEFCNTKVKLPQNYS